MICVFFFFHCYSIHLHLHCLTAPTHRHFRILQANAAHKKNMRSTHRRWWYCASCVHILETNLQFDVLLLCGHKHFTIASICNRLNETVGCLISILVHSTSGIWFNAKYEGRRQWKILSSQQKKENSLKFDEIPFDIIRSKSHFQKNILNHIIVQMLTHSDAD